MTTDGETREEMKFVKGSCILNVEKNALSAQMLKVYLLGAGTLFLLKRGAWSVVE